MDSKWTKEQKLAIDKKYGNILVSASAGSGKTSVLVERVISKVLKQQIDIDKLLIVTFTNASAAELKERLLTAIYKELEKDPKNQFLKRQLVNINVANINTIHSFCLKLIRQNFYLLNLDPSISVCDDTTSSILKSKAFQTVLEEEYSKYSKDDNKIGLYMILELFGSKEEDFVTAMLDIYRYIQSFAHPFDWLKEQINKYLIQDNLKDLFEYDFGKEIYQDSIDDLKVLLLKTYNYLESMKEEPDYTKYIDCLNSDIENIERCIKCGNNSWDLLYENVLLFNLMNFPRNKVLNEEPKKAYKKFRDKYIKESRDNLKNTIYAKSQNIFEELKSSYNYLEYIYNFIEKFDKEYTKLKLESNYIDFNDIEHMALQLLLEKKDKEYIYTDIAKAYQEKILEVYIDEYQDTSFVQEAILESVSGSKNRFMVGDIKQSIYKFRQAMPEIFNKKYAEYKLLEEVDASSDSLQNSKDCFKIILSNNFRSRETVIDSINYIFRKIMSSSVGQCEYTNAEALKFSAKNYTDNTMNDYSFELNVVDKNKKNLTQKPNEAIEVEQYNEGEVEETEYNEENYETTKEALEDIKGFEIEARYIAKRIEELVSKNEFKVSAKNGFSDVSYKDIVILMRNLSNKGIVLENALKERKIPVFSDSNLGFFESDEIKLVLAFLQIIDNPLQDISLVSVMYSIIGKFSIDELTIIHGFAKNDYLYNGVLKFKEAFEKGENENSKDLYLKVCDFLELYNKFSGYSRVYSISELLMYIFNETNMYIQFALSDRVNEVKASLDFLVELAIKFENENSSSLYSYISYVDSVSKKGESKDASAKIIGENENVVRIMTIHKSKGLEFPVVILCDTAASYSTQDLKKDVMLHHNSGIGINYVDASLNISYPCVIKQAIKNVITKESKSEELRLLYVALTRAKEKLIIFGNVSDFDKLIEDTFVIQNSEGIIDPIVVQKNNSYFKNICMALKDNIVNNVGNIKLKINISKVFEEKNSGQAVDNNICSVRESTTKKVELLESYIDKDKISQDRKIEEKINDIMKNVLEFKYPNQINCVTENRVSVSKLKKQNDDVFEKNLVSENTNLEDKSSETLSSKFTLDKLLNEEDEDKLVNPARKGTLIHFILEHLDFKNLKTKKQIQVYLDELAINKVISKADVKQINIDSIFIFLNSKIGSSLSQKDDKSIFRETEFVLKDKSFSNSTIQGVIDLYYVDDKTDEITLVDFKTDKIYDEKTFVEKYKLQLDIYKSALEKLLNKKVSKVYIYSFNLNKEIEVSW